MPAHNVVAIFSSRDVAERARNHLISHGFARETVRLSSDRFDQAEHHRAVQDQIEREQSNSGFFGWLFGSGTNNDARSVYEKRLSGERVALSVLADEAHQADVEDILDQYAPVDLYEDAAGTEARQRSEHEGLSSGLGSISVAREQFTSARTGERSNPSRRGRHGAAPENVTTEPHASPEGAGQDRNRYRFGRHAAGQVAEATGDKGEGTPIDWTVGPDGKVTPGNTVR